MAIPFRRLASALLVVGFAGSPSAQAPQPPPMYSVGAAYDAARGRLVVFGGYFSGGYSGDTWEWDGRAWTRFGGPGPSARNGPVLAYDESRREIVMFGGDTRATGPLGDTWTFNGTAWRQAATSGPPGRSGHAMAYYAKRQRTVLFGGNTGGPAAMLGDTWEWDGTTWTAATGGGPSARALFGMAYDSRRERTVLFGGTSEFGPNAPSHGDTWEWDGRQWAKVADTGPSARDHVSMAYDAARHVTVLHGGGMDPASRETWAFDGRAWRRLSTDGPPRRFPQLVFEPGGTLLLYGGFDRQPSNELWRFDGSAWKKIAG